MYRYSKLILEDEVVGYRVVSLTDNKVVFDVNRDYFTTPSWDVSGITSETELVEHEGEFISRSEKLTGTRVADITGQHSKIVNLFKPYYLGAQRKKREYRDSNYSRFTQLTPMDLKYKDGVAMSLASWSLSCDGFRKINSNSIIVYFAFKSESAVVNITNLLESRLTREETLMRYREGKRVFRVSISKTQLLHLMAEQGHFLGITEDKVKSVEEPWCQQNPIITKDETPDFEYGDEDQSDLEIALGRTIFYKGYSSEELQRLSKLDMPQ